MNKTIKTALWRWTIRKARMLVDMIDEWLHNEEVRMRESAQSAPSGPVAPPIEVDRTASRAREKVIHKTRVAHPRLRYQGGQFVRQE